jgi:hypothetical protein
VTDGGLSVGFDLPTQGIVALAQATDKWLALKARDAVLDLARADAAAKGRPDPVQKDDVRGVTIYQLGDVHLAVLGKWLLATNKRLLFAMVLENIWAIALRWQQRTVPGRAKTARISTRPGCMSICG